MEMMQFYYFCQFSVWTSAIVLLLLHWPHPASAHLLQQGDVYLRQEEIKALPHELQICKSHTVQIDCGVARQTARVGPPTIWNQDTRSCKAHMQLAEENNIKMDTNKEEGVQN